MNHFNIIKSSDKNSWDKYYLNICNAVASKSPCLSRQIGAILVRDKSVISTGYNGPARGIPHCTNICPRRELGFKSGEGMEHCYAQHAEENCISNAARNGVITVGAILYMNTVIPCKNCFSTLINAGVTEIVVLTKTAYDKYTRFIVDNSTIKLREFQL